MGEVSRVEGHLGFPRLLQDPRRAPLEGLDGDGLPGHALPAPGAGDDGRDPALEGFPPFRVDQGQVVDGQVFGADGLGEFVGPAIIDADVAVLVDEAGDDLLAGRVDDASPRRDGDVLPDRDDLAAPNEDDAAGDGRTDGGVDRRSLEGDEPRGFFSGREDRDD